MADRSRWSTASALCGEMRLRFMERETFRDDGVVALFDQRDQARVQRDVLLAGGVHRMTGSAQQSLHLSRPALLLDLNQGLQLI